MLREGLESFKSPGQAEKGLPRYYIFNGRVEGSNSIFLGLGGAEGN